jgi:DNA-binding protein H-NS
LGAAPRDLRRAQKSFRITGLWRMLVVPRDWTKYMTKTSAQINRQIEQLQRRAAALKKREMRGVITRIREAIDYYGLTASDLGLGPRGAGAASKATRKAAGRKVSARKARQARPPSPVKYRDGAGNTWSGRGKRPQWFKSALEAGKTLEELSV